MNQTSSQTTKQSTGLLGGPIVKNGVPKGNYEVNLVGITAAAWSQNKGTVTDVMNCDAFCLGIKAGSKVRFTIWESDSNKPDAVIATKDVSVSGDKVSIQWKFPSDKFKKSDPKKRPSLPSYYFSCEHASSKSVKRSSKISFTGDLTIKLLDENSTPVAGQRYQINFATQKVENGKTDSSGIIKFPKAYVGSHYITFPGNSFISFDKASAVDSPFQTRNFMLNFFAENTFYAQGFVVKCSHHCDDHYRFVMNPPFYEVVQESLKTRMIPGMKYKMESELVEIFTSSKKQLSEKNGTQGKKTIESGAEKYVYELEFKEKHDSVNIFSSAFWNSFTKTTDYEIQGLRKALPVKVYSPDKYGVSIAFPTPKKFEAGAKYMSDKAEKIEQSLVKSYLPKNVYFEPPDPNKDSTQYGTVNHPLAIGSAKRPINITVNGNALDISALDAFGTVLLLIKGIQKISEMITQSIPQAGWYCSFENKFFEGTFGLTWCWKEYNDHRVFLNWAAFVDFTILSVNMEIGVGFSSFNIIGQIYANLSGSVKVSANLERISPENSLELKIPFSTVIEGAIGARVKASVFFSAELKGITGLAINNGTFKISRPFEISASLKWTGLKASISCSAGVGKSGGVKKNAMEEQSKAGGLGKEQVFVDEVELKPFKFPSDEKYIPAYTSPERMKEIFEKVFTKGWNVSIVDANDKIVDREIIIALIVKEINKRPDVDKSERTIEAMALAIRQYIENRYVRIGMFSEALRYSELCNFLYKGQLTKMFDNCIDTALVMANQLKT